MTEWIGRLDDSTKINGGRNGTTRTKRGKSSNNNDTNEGGRWNAEGCAAEWSGDWEGAQENSEQANVEVSAWSDGLFYQ